MKIKCQQHPNYYGKGKPHSNCKKCWEIWNRKNYNKVDSNSIEEEENKDYN